MQRLQRLLQKEVEKPHSFEQLKQKPFPYLHECSRNEIFEFIYHLETQNQQLKNQVQEKYPGKSLEDIRQDNKKMKLIQKMIALHKGSIENMEVELKEKVLALEALKTSNKELEGLSRELQEEMKGLEGDTVEVERERRELQFQLKLFQDKQSKIDASEIFLNLYKEVKNILEESI